MMDVFRNLPSLVLDVNVRVEDDSDEEKVTAGSIVTITIGMKRQTCGDIVDAADNDEVKVYVEYLKFFVYCKGMTFDRHTNCKFVGNDCQRW